MDSEEMDQEEQSALARHRADQAAGTLQTVSNEVARERLGHVKWGDVRAELVARAGGQRVIATAAEELAAELTRHRPIEQRPADDRYQGRRSQGSGATQPDRRSDDQAE